MCLELTLAATTQVLSSIARKQRQEVGPGAASHPKDLIEKRC